MNEEKEKNTNCGIYLITNLINGKQYIGQSVNIYHRWICHQNPRDIENTPINLAIKKYGKNNFKFEIIENCLQKELNEKEIYWIKYYNTLVPNGYNIRQGGEQGLLYDYEAIYNKWQEGYLCKELEEIFNCNDRVIHNALLAYGVTQEEIYNKKLNKKSIIAFDIKTKKPLKIFSSIQEASKILSNSLNGCSSIRIALKNPFENTAYGFYWNYKENDSLNIENIDINTFLQYQNKIKHYSEEYKENMSLKNRKVERPSREELKNEIRTTSFLQLSYKYKVSDNAIKKWCDYYNLPRRKRDINKISNEDWINI